MCSPTPRFRPPARGPNAVGDFPVCKRTIEPAENSRYVIEAKRVALNGKQIAGVPYTIAPSGRRRVGGRRFFMHSGDGTGVAIGELRESQNGHGVL